MRYIGIDPGATGAVALIRNDGKVKIFDTPNATVKVAKRKVKEQDVAASAALLKRLIEKRPCVICLEAPQPIWFISRIAMFSLGRGRGLWEGIIGSLSHPLILVKPTEWKKVLFGDKLKKKTGTKAQKQRKGKEADVALAQKLYPRAKIKRHDQADAVLLAHYAKLQRKKK